MKWILFISIFFISCQQGNSDGSASKNANTSELPGMGKDKAADPIQQKQKKIAADRLIVPGESIGNTRLDARADSLEILLGKPDMSDAAMGKAWLTWNGKRDEHNNATQLNIYTTYKDNTMREKTVQQMRSTSSYFSTDNGLHVYSSLSDILREFPDISKAGHYHDDGRDIIIYDAKNKGIAFEIASANDQKICTGIIIHTKGKDVMEIYLSLHS